MKQATEPKFANLDEVIMKKADLIKSLQKNKEKHDTLFEVSVSGYWELANTKLVEKKEKLKKSLEVFDSELTLSFEKLEKDIHTRINQIEKSIQEKEQLPANIYYENFIAKAFSWDNNLALTYPINHSQDYAEVISAMEASIYDTVRLTTQQYNQYVLNNWEWKSQFLNIGNFYLQACTGSYYSANTNLISGSLLGAQDASAVNYTNSKRSIVNF